MPVKCTQGPGDDAVELAVGLVNTWDRLASPPEQLRDGGALRRFLYRHGDEEAAGRGTDADADRARDLRERLRGAFEAPDEETAVQVLNALLLEGGALPELTRHDGLPWHFHYGPSDVGGVATLPAVTAIALLDVIRTLGWERLGRCAAAPCASVFVDRSRNRSRRYCSQLCADRMTQAAHRQRQRSAQAAGGARSRATTRAGSQPATESG
ncbi:MAG: CGNR zinc finger domain-containing protein [Gaiellaceae bacterium]